MTQRLDELIRARPELLDGKWVDPATFERLTRELIPMCDAMFAASYAPLNPESKPFLDFPVNIHVFAEDPTPHVQRLRRPAAPGGSIYATEAFSRGHARGLLERLGAQQTGFVPHISHCVSVYDLDTYDTRIFKLK